MRILLAVKGTETLKVCVQALSTTTHNFVPPLISQGLILIIKFTSVVEKGRKRGHGGYFFQYHLLYSKGHLTVTKGRIEVSSFSRTVGCYLPGGVS